MEIIENNTRTYSAEETGIDLRGIFELFLNNWKWFFLSIAICVGATYYYVNTLSPVYKRSAVMLVKEQQNDYMDMNTVIANYGMVGVSNIENEIYMLRSNQLMHEVVRRLNLDIIYTQKQGLRTQVVYGEIPFKCRFLGKYLKPVSFNVTGVTPKGVQINGAKIIGEDIDYKALIQFNDTIQTPMGALCFIPIEQEQKFSFEEPVTVTRINDEVATGIFMGKISTSALSENGTMVNIVCSDVSIARADDILNEILKVYNKTIVDDKNKIATNTAAFIDERIQIIARELGDVEHRLTEFKQKNRMVNIESKASLSLAEEAKVKDESVKLEAQLSVVSFVRDFINNVANENELIPNVAGIGDAGVDQQIVAYNEILLRRNRLVSNSSIENSVVKKLDVDLNAMRSTIAGSIESYLRTLEVQMNNAKRQQSRVNASIQNIPVQEKYALDVMRQQAIKETLYTYLLQKREENAMKMAITEANIRVMEAPFGSRTPISPNKKLYLFVSFLIGFALPALIIALRMLLDTGVRGRRDIERYTTLPVLGDIPERPEKTGDADIVVSETHNDHITEAFRLLRSNVNFMYKGAKVLMFTSTMTSEGKTFISRNYAAVLGMSGHKVILVDTDIRKSKQGRLLGIHSKEGLTSYLNGDNRNLDELILSDRIAKNVDILLTGKMPPNPAELLMSERFDELIEELKKRYDYVILDNVPALVVADAAIVNRVADVTLYVMRDGVVDRRYLPELERIHKAGKFNNMCLILNDIKEAKSSYGYSYSYGYGYGYGNGYGYYSEDAKNKRHHVVSRKSFLSRMFIKRK